MTLFIVFMMLAVLLTREDGPRPPTRWYDDEYWRERR